MVELHDVAAHILIVEPNPSINWRIQRACDGDKLVTACHDFQTARVQLLSKRPDVLVTNLRLEEYNGLHLIVLSRTANSPARCIVHTDRPDFMLIAEAQSLGALFERTERLPSTLPHYLRNHWPPADRRDPHFLDRRSLFRGGRRAFERTARKVPARQTELP